MQAFFKKNLKFFCCSPGSTFFQGGSPKEGDGFALKDGLFVRKTKTKGKPAYSKRRGGRAYAQERDGCKTAAPGGNAQNRPPSGIDPFEAGSCGGLPFVRIAAGFSFAAAPLTAVSPNNRCGLYPRNYTLKRNSTMSPSCMTYSLPSLRTSPFSRAAAMVPQAMRSSKAMTSARMKPRSKSE